MRALALVFAAALAGCAGSERRFPMREPMWRDTDLAAVFAPCRAAPTAADPRHVSCAPAPYDSPLYWDGADNLFFRPLSNALGLVTSGESVNVNSLDEVPDSAWFENRLGVRAMTPDEIARGACTPAQILDPEHDADGSWVIDKGKMQGSTPGFRMTVRGKGKFLVKVEGAEDQPERAEAASVIGAAVLHAVGYNAACEQVVYARPSLFELRPGLRSKANFEAEKRFDRRALDAMFARAPKRGGHIRMSASAWIPGYSIGPYRFEGTRDDDPNDVVPHEDRRDLRAMRVVAAWLDRFDAREANSLDTWIATGRAPDASPGYVLHYQLDTSETLGALWQWDELSRRLGSSYVLDWGDVGLDFVTLGLPLRPWDTAKRGPTFGYFDARLDPEAWKSEYSNAAFERMTERDAAWMARILARVDPAAVRALARAGDFSDPANADWLASVLETRLERILDRWLTRLSPIGDLHVDGGALCGVDLAEMRRVRPPARFRYTARVLGGGALAVRREPGGRVCVALPRAGDGRYLRVVLGDGVAAPLVAHLYDAPGGFMLAGILR